MGDVFKALAIPPDARSSTNWPIATARPLRDLQSADHEAPDLVLAAGDLQHLDLLEAAGLVHSRRDGRYKFHYLDMAPLDRITERWRPKEKK